jgi:hypothetical protein
LSPRLRERHVPKFTFAPQVSASHPAGYIDSRNRTLAALASSWYNTGEDLVGRSF